MEGKVCEDDVWRGRCAKEMMCGGGRYEGGRYVKRRHVKGEGV